MTRTINGEKSNFQIKANNRNPSCKTKFSVRSCPHKYHKENVSNNTHYQNRINHNKQVLKQAQRYKYHCSLKDTYFVLEEVWMILTTIRIVMETAYICRYTKPHDGIVKCCCRKHHKCYSVGGRNYDLYWLPFTYYLPQQLTKTKRTWTRDQTASNQQRLAFRRSEQTV